MKNSIYDVVDLLAQSIFVSVLITIVFWGFAG
jgi:hypothetical protein